MEDDRADAPRYDGLAGRFVLRDDGDGPVIADRIAGVMLALFAIGGPVVWMLACSLGWFGIAAR